MTFGSAVPAIPARSATAGPKLAGLLLSALLLAQVAPATAQSFGGTALQQQTRKDQLKRQQLQERTQSQRKFLKDMVNGQSPAEARPDYNAARSRQRQDAREAERAEQLRRWQLQQQQQKPPRPRPDTQP